jgi:hypothetical protein
LPAVLRWLEAAPPATQMLNERGLLVRVYDGPLGGLPTHVTPEARLVMPPHVRLAKGMIGADWEHARILTER